MEGAGPRRKDAATSLIALLALARVGGPAANEDLFGALARFPLSTLSDPLRIQKLRVIEVAVSRNGKPSSAAIQRLIADVDGVFPGSSFELNTEMSQILSAFNAPDRRREDDAPHRPDEDLRGALRLSLQPPFRDRRMDARSSDRRTSSGSMKTTTTTSIAMSIASGSTA